MAVVAITGAGRGIGLELTRQHVEAGDRVFALVRDPALASDLADLASANEDRLTVHAMDVGDSDSVRAGAASTGDDPINLVYNVAGVAGPAGPELESADWAAWDDVYAISVQGPLRVLQAFLPRLGEGSKVINFSSQLGASTWPMGGYYAYASAKAALNRLMRSVAIDLKDRGVVIGLIHPGWVRTDMGGPQGEISPEESAAGVRQTAANWTIAESGDFKNWKGEPHAW